jgi:hypothetical protein
MFNWFLRYVVGGITGKRESALMAWVLWLMWTAIIMWLEADGITLPITNGMWNITTPMVWSWLGAAFGFEWWSTHAKRIKKDEDT